MKKYIVYPDHVISIKDNELHFIPALEVMRLYKVDRSECLIFGTQAYFEYFTACSVEQFNTLIKLHPRSDDNYTL